MDLEEKLRLKIKKPHSLTNYLWALHTFQKSVGMKDNYDSWDVIEFLSLCELNEQSTVTVYYLLKRIFLYAEWSWDQNLLEKPKVENESRVSILEKETIIRSIENAHKLTDLERGIWVLSTVWGMRREEIKRVTKDKIDLSANSKKLLISTAKGGVQRWSPIPLEIEHVLENYEPKNITVCMLNLKFHEILQKTTGEARHGYGFHAVRHSLIVNLLPPFTPLSDTEVFRFMRWSEGAAGVMNILYRYAKAAREQDWFKIDRRVFEYHPWLEYWRDQKGG